MRVGWLADASEYEGGAELTQAEFRAAAPVEVVDCPPGEIKPADRYVVHNHLTYSPTDEIDLNCEVIRYRHDMREQLWPGTRNIFCSPVQREELGLEGECIPPPVDLKAFTPSRQQRRNTERKGTCSIGAWMNPGKAGWRVAEWADRNEPVDAYGFGPFRPQGRNVRDCGSVDRAELPTVLGMYERFVFLPDALEPFGRCVAEAWAAGCEVITNERVGAKWWIENDPEKLETAADDFWRVVLSDV